MTPGARVQAAIDLLDLIIAAARDDGAPADRLASQYFRERRYIGSKDRRAVRDLVWQAIRAFGERPDSGRAAMLGLAADDAALEACFDGSRYGPAALQPHDAREAVKPLPDWVCPRLSALVTPDEWPAMLTRAPVDLRINRLKDGDVDLAGAESIAGFPDLLRLPTDTPLADHPAFQAGLVEVQDAGSQAIVMACAAQPGMTVLDLCAGAGGKTLALAAAMGGKGRLIAADTNRARLSQLGPRAERAGAIAIEQRLLDPGKEAEQLADLADACDIVLIDAPCSGSGTWRRSPEARWRMTPQNLARTTALQAMLLDLAAPLVKPGGALVYAVCSILAEEGAGQAAAFSVRQSGFSHTPLHLPFGRADGEGTLLTPFHDGTDGFFFTRYQRLC